MPGFVTMPLPKASFVTDLPGFVTMPTSEAPIVTEMPGFVTMPLQKASFVMEISIFVTIPEKCSGRVTELPFVGWNESVAGNLFFVPVVFFPSWGDEISRVADAEGHVGDWQSFLYVVGLVEGAD